VSSKFYSENLNGRDDLEDLRADESILKVWILQGFEVWTGLKWLIIECI
jgi:hypothetical protein